MTSRPTSLYAFVAVLPLTAATPALADTPCDTVTFPRAAANALHLVRVKPGPNARFLTGRGDCPAASPACRQTAYVVPGNLLITSGSHGGYLCAYYSNGRSEAAGWLPASQLQAVAQASLPRSAWLGTWRYGDSTITIKSVGDELAVSAQAFWPSRTDPNGHEGHLDAQSKPLDRDLALSDPDDPEGCKLDLSLLAGYLRARDNAACGGANVTLSGIYRK